MDKFTPEWQLLENAVKRNAAVIAKSFPAEAQKAIIEQEQIINDCKKQLKTAINESSHIIHSVI